MLINIPWLGQIEYGAALKLQKSLVFRRAADEIPDTLLLLEHPHTYTVGLDGHQGHILISHNEMTRLNIAYCEADRNGGITYHGPGQLMGYPILNLGEHDCDYYGYINRLESIIIRTLSFYKVRAFRQRGRRGVWVFAYNSTFEATERDNRIARIGNVGIKVNNDQITSHGFSINVNPNLAYFDKIMPDGIEGCNITSLCQILNRPINTESVLETIIQSFCEVFETNSRVCLQGVTTNE